jgi:hypothetical protein
MIVFEPLGPTVIRLKLSGACSTRATQAPSRSSRDDGLAGFSTSVTPTIAAGGVTDRLWDVADMVICIGGMGRPQRNSYLYSRDYLFLPPKGVDSDAKCNTLGRSGSPRKDRFFLPSPPPSSAVRDAKAAPSKGKTSRFQSAGVLHFASEFRRFTRLPCQFSPVLGLVGFHSRDRCCAFAICSRVIIPASLSRCSPASRAIPRSLPAAARVNHM